MALLALQEIPSPLVDLLAAMLAQLEHSVWVLMWVPQALSSVLLHPNPTAWHLGTANNHHPLDWVFVGSRGGSITPLSEGDGVLAPGRSAGGSVAPGRFEDGGQLL